jgi:hypothetical protein
MRYRVKTQMRKRPGYEKYGIIGSILIWVTLIFFVGALYGSKTILHNQKAPYQLLASIRNRIYAENGNLWLCQKS